jgi:hypothetical protein
VTPKRDAGHEQGAESTSRRVTTSARRDLSGPWTRDIPKVAWPKDKPRTKPEATVLFVFVAIPWIGIAAVAWLLLR